MSERVPLSFLLTEHKDEKPPVEPIPGFAVLYNEEFWIFKSLLERTAVLVAPDDQYKTVTAHFEYIQVDPRIVEWQAKTPNIHDPTTWRRPPGGRPPQDVDGRAAGDKRAIASQERQRQREEHERAELRRRSAEEAARREEGSAAGLRVLAEDELDDNTLSDRSEFDGSFEDAEWREAEERQHPASAVVPPVIARHRTAQVQESAEPQPPPTARPLAQPVKKLSVRDRQLTDERPVGRCAKCGATGRLDDAGVCTRHKPRGKRSERPANNIGAEVTPAPAVKRPARHRTRPEGCLRGCRPWRDDAYHAIGCPNRIEQLKSFDRKAPPTAGCAACEKRGSGVRHAVGCPHRRGPLSNAEMVALAAGTLKTVGSTTTTSETAIAITPAPIELAPLPTIERVPTRDDWLALLTRLRATVAENRVLKTSLRELYDDLNATLVETNT